MARQHGVVWRWGSVSQQVMVTLVMLQLSGLAYTGDSPRNADGLWSFDHRKGPPWQPDALRFCAGPAKVVSGDVSSMATATRRCWRV